MTYHVSGTLMKENFGIQIDNEERHFNYFVVCQEIEADNRRAARDHFETSGWEWETEPEIRLVTEAMKMERAGQPTLFDLAEVER